MELTWTNGRRLIVDIPAARYHGQLCGLCGNNNGIRSDDYVTGNGALVPPGQTVILIIITIRNKNNVDLFCIIICVFCV